MSHRSKHPRRQQRYDHLAVLEYIDRFQQAHEQRSPSQRHICARFWISAPSVAHNILHRLERFGYLQILPMGRGLGADLVITEAGREQIRDWRERQRG